jgi:predicted secreted protein
MQKNKEPNPLNFFEIRRQEVPCPHFEYICLPTTYNLEHSLSKWITENLKGRYYLGKSLYLSESGQIENVMKVGFEDPKECSYFTLACPHLKYN